MRTTRANLTAAFNFATDRARAAGIDTDGWSLSFGSKAYDYRYEIVGRTGAPVVDPGSPVHIDLGATSTEAHVTLTALGAAWHLAATVATDRPERT